MHGVLSQDQLTRFSFLRARSREEDFRQISNRFLRICTTAGSILGTYNGGLCDTILITVLSSTFHLGYSVVYFSFQPLWMWTLFWRQDTKYVQDISNVCWQNVVYLCCLHSLSWQYHHKPRDHHFFQAFNIFSVEIHPEALMSPPLPLIRNNIFTNKHFLHSCFFLITLRYKSLFLYLCIRKFLVVTPRVTGISITTLYQKVTDRKSNKKCFWQLLIRIFKRISDLN